MLRISLTRTLRGALFFWLAFLLIGPGLSMAASLDSPNLLPCDIYANAGTACVAAHSTTRALFKSFNGSLYQVKRASDGQTMDIPLLAKGGYANAAAQDKFCAGTTCMITIIYDQTSYHNDLTIEGRGGNGGPDTGVPADALPTTAGGVKVYGASFSGGMGYRNESASGVARGGNPEGLYMVTSGTHYNSGCCFDYGNAETSNNDTGNGHMDSINFGNECWFAPCSGSGPWVQADLENGLFQSGAGPSQNPANTGDTEPFVTAMLKNNGRTTFTLKHGNAQSGALATSYSGSLPTNGYQPMSLEGSIVLGTGGDNSNGSIGSFFEGVMTQGVPSDATDDAVQNNIIAVGYGGPTAKSGELTADSTISLNATTPCCTTRYISLQAGGNVQSKVVDTEAVAANSGAAAKQDGSWIVRAGLADPSCYSFESRDNPGAFMRHYNYHVYLQPMDGTQQYREDATFCAEPAKNGKGTSFHSYNYPTRYLRHFANVLYVSSDGGPNDFDNANSWADDVSWVIAAPWAP
ncbi:Extracellular exo-alpha-(1-_5)-L-arabinofuranosidase [Burkholderia glumae]|nr:Extracellular exo-alpha-(1->5)-L-arabinofuranosidase [Burkholderia glumae]